MRIFPRNSIALLKYFFLFVLLLLLAAYFILRGSLPDLSGEKIITLLEHPVNIERDAQGIPTIRAFNRVDTAFALGYVHAQERFFQMDLLRRRAAGELSNLLGHQLYDKDKAVAIHRFRERARQLLRSLPLAHFKILQTYTNGVNAGIEMLANDPYQYLLVDKVPEPWQAEDSILCVFAMYFDLNDELGSRKTSLMILKENLGEQWFTFLSADSGHWDAMMDQPSPQVVNPPLPIPEHWPAVKFTDNNKQRQTAYSERNYFLPGSNSMAIDATLTPYTSAMLANDMHLALRVPNIWFRASWYLADGRRVTGLTLPGVPAMIVGSNENIAWGFTNSYGDWDDIIRLKTNKQQTRYLTPEGWKDFTIYNHRIAGHMAENDQVITIETIWGPVIGKNSKGELLVHQWIAYAPQAVNMMLLELEQSYSVHEALMLTPRLGMPPQNIVLADNTGHIAWSIAGVIADRTGKSVSAQLSVDNQGWQNYLPPEDYPVYHAQDSHRIWTANNRLFSDKKLSLAGFTGGDIGARAQQIRDALLAGKQFNEQDLLAIQLDDRGLFLQRWQQLLLTVLQTEYEHRAEARVRVMIKVLKQEKDLRASVDSVAYGLVKQFRQQVIDGTIGLIYDALEEQYKPLFKRSSIDKQSDYPAWALASQQPQYLLPAGFDSWQQFLIMAARNAYNDITRDGQLGLLQQNWAKLHTIKIHHPLSAAFPGLGYFLDMPDTPIGGDNNMPKVMTERFGASMRMVVAPGQEQNGIMHMPAGQSSHPLSDYYTKGHQDWLAAKASPFLPGKTKWRLKLDVIH